MSLTLSNSESVYLITPVATLKPRFWDNSVFVYFLVVNNNKYLSYVVDNIIFGISVLNTPVKPLKASLYGYFGISVCFVDLIFI